MAKICTKCSTEKELDQFNNQKAGKFGRRATCRDCQSKEHKAYKQTEHAKKLASEWKTSTKGRECEQRYRDRPRTKARLHLINTTDRYRTLRRIRADKERFGGNRVKALERDGYKCVVCSTTNMIQVHHKDGLGRNKPREIQNHNLSNLITLCASCHIKQHNPVLVRWQKCGVI